MLTALLLKTAPYKKLKHIYFIIFLFLTALSPVFAGNYPFPQNFNYPYGIKATNANTATLSTRYTQWKATYVTSDGCYVGLRVKRPSDGGDTVSEGMGYGMVISVYFDDQATFDGLWKFKTYCNDPNGLMNWQISSGGNGSGKNAATDGDEDIAFALIEADKQWGSGGTFNYLNLAKGEIAKIKQYEIDSATHHVKPGDVWDSYEFPAYYMPAYYRLFGEVTNDAAFWNAVVAICASHIQSARNTSYGLVPTNINHDGTRNGNSYDYDSCRVPWRYANDYVWNGDAASKAEIDLFAAFFGPKGAAAIVDGYAVDTGNPTSSNHNAAFTGPAACSLMTGSPVTSQATLNSFYSVVEAMDVTSSYYQGCIQMITLLLLSGNLPDFRHLLPINTPSSTPTLNLSFTKTYTVTVTPTSTITPIPPPTHKLNLEVMNSTGSGSCADQMKIKMKITNWDSVAIVVSTLKLRVWLNTSKALTVEKYDGRVYNALAGDLGAFTAVTLAETVLAVPVNYGGRTASKYVDITFGGAVDIPANGGYLYMDGVIRNTDWSSPLDTSCDSYSQMPASYTVYTNDSHFNLIEGTNLVCEYLDASTQDTANTGVDPRTGGNGCSVPPTKTVTPLITNTFTATSTRTATRTYTATFTPTGTPMLSPTFTATKTATATFTWTATGTPTITVGTTFTSTATGTRSITPTLTFTVINTNTFTATSTCTATRTYTATFTPTGTSVLSPTFTATKTATATFTCTVTVTPTITVGTTFTFTATGTRSITSTLTFTAIITNTFTVTPTLTITGTATYTSTASPSKTATQTRTPSFTKTQTPTGTATATFTVSNTHTVSPTETSYAGTPTSSPTITETLTVTLSETVSVTQTATQTDVDTVTQTATEVDTQTAVFTQTPTFTATASNTVTLTETDTLTAQPTDTQVIVFTPTVTVTVFVPTKTFTGTNTPQATATGTYTSTKTFTGTSMPTQTNTPTCTQTGTFTAPAVTDTPTPGNNIEVVTATPVLLYPNPNIIPGVITDRKVDFTVNRPISKIEFKIYTNNGRLIRKAVENTPQSQGKCTLTVPNIYFKDLARGIYYYVIIVKDQTTGKEAKSPIEKLVIQ